MTESLLALVPLGGVLAIDASEDMVTLARSRLGDRAQVWCQDVLDLDLAEPVDVIVSTAALHWVSDHDRLWGRLAGALRPGGILEAQCGGQGNIARVREVVDTVARTLSRSWWAGLRGCSRARRRPSGACARPASARFGAGWKTGQRTPRTSARSSGTSILVAHLARLPEERRNGFVTAVVGGVRPPLDYVRLNVSAVRGPE